MRKIIVLVVLLSVLTGCVRATAVPTPTRAATKRPTQAQPSDTPLPPTSTIAPSSTPIPTATLAPYPVEGLGPTGFPDNVDPYTGLEVADPTIMNRRPVIIKVENLPREHRPQYGLSLADLVYEYYTEQGTTRFAAIYYGQDAPMVGPIRSGRFFDVNLVQMYKGVFVFGSAYYAVWNAIFTSDFATRVVLENPYSCPALCRFEPKGSNLLVANTSEINAYLKARVVDNFKQNQDGMLFKMIPPTGGENAAQVFVRFSGAIYNRWDFDPATGRYLRFEDVQNDVNHTNEVYAQLTDKSNAKPITAENVVTICVPHEYYAKTDETEVVKMIMDVNAGSYTGCDGKKYAGGTGAAYVARDGQMYKVSWSTPKKSTILQLVGDDGKPFALKPGQTWFEVIGASSKVEQKDPSWRFTFAIVP
jgi:hypothetical protein